MKPRSTGRRVLLLGGPLHGQKVIVAGSEYNVGRFWTYDFAGSVGGQIVFVKRPNARWMRRAILHQVGLTGRHPLVERLLSRPEPFRKPKEKKA